MNDAATPIEGCRAYLRDNGLVVCDRCARAWSPAGARKDCAAVTFGWMKAIVEREADYIEQTQAALVKAGARALPDIQETETALVLRAVVRLVERITASETIMHELQAKRPNGEGR